MSKFQFHLAIDGNEANISNRVGSNVYAFEIIRHLERILRDIPDIKTTVLLAHVPIPELPPERIGFTYRVISPTPFWTQLALPLHLLQKKESYDLLFTPGHYAPQACPIPYISSVMDLAFLTYPDHFKQRDLWQLKYWTAGSVKKARKIIAISQFTQSEIVKHHKRKATDIVVAPPALSALPQLTKAEVKAELVSMKLTTPYIVYMGTLQPRKNLLNLITAFSELKQTIKKLPTQQASSLESLQLILAGKVGWLADPILQAISTSPDKNDIHQLGYVTERQKVALYHGASASALVGLYEGFGIPPLESIACGCVPIVSNSTSLPEVVGKAGVLVDPLSPSAISEGLLHVLTATPKQKAIWHSAGIRQLQQFDWEHSAHLVLDAILAELKQTC